MDIRALAGGIDRDWPVGLTSATTAELTHSGLGPRRLTAGVKFGLLLRIRHGVYIRRGDWEGLYPSQRDELRLLAHCQATKATALYSHLSAARLRGLYVWNGSPDVHVTAKSALAGDSAVPGVRVHRRTLAPEQRRRITLKRYGVVRVTSLEQTIVDCARTEPFVTAVIIGDSGLHKGASLELMNQLVAGMDGHRGVRAARRVLAALDKGSQSAGETRLRLVVAGMNIPQPEYQVWLLAAGNNYRVDGAWRAIKLALEFDGKSKYFDYQRTDEAIYEERQRERELMEVGWMFLRVEWKDLADPDLLKRRIRAAIDAASRRFKP